jgi:hypothetical protein
MTTTTGPVVERLDEDTCWDLLSSASVGRLAVASIDHGPEIFPVNYLVADRTILFASAPGTKLMRVVADPKVAFEVDELTQPSWWSIVVHGRAERMSSGLDIERVGIRGIRTFSPGDKWNYVRIVPDEISGRRRAVERARPGTKSHHTK